MWVHVSVYVCFLGPHDCNETLEAHLSAINVFILLKSVIRIKPERLALVVV